MLHAAFSFTPDTFGIGEKSLGRRVANTAFLRAAMAAHRGEPLVAFGYEEHHATAFAEALRSLDPAARGRWLLASQFEDLAAQRVLHRLDPGVQAEVAARAWIGLGRYSITAVTHTTFNLLPTLAQFVREPLTPWDALICTSRSVRSTVEAVWNAELDYARWRYGPDAAPQLPQLPVIPLGVHTADFAFDDARRAQARAELGLAPGDVVALYVGRLSLMSKAHPAQMYAGLAAAAERTGASVTLVECGWARTQDEADAFRDGVRRLAPGVRHVVLDGNDPSMRARAWAAGDLFISLSDNIQETFGLAPLEAMAAGLPVVASDWDGYRDTVRDGVDGFLIPTWAPAPGVGSNLAFAHQSRTITDETLGWGAASATSIDAGVLVNRLATLISDPDLRRRMGAEGRRQAREAFDWSVIYGRYQALWAELDARRQTDGADAMAVRPGGQLEPFTAFATYPTHHIGRETRIALRDGAEMAAYEALADHPLYPSGAAMTAFGIPLWRLLQTGPRTVEAASQVLGLPARNVLLAAGVLVKMGFATFEVG